MTATARPQLGVYSASALPLHMQDRIVIDANGCWRWQTGHDRHGYGRCSLSFPWTTRRRWSAHRLSYLLLVGPIPEGLQLDHLCMVRDCVNPSHLEPVTPLENVRRSGAADYWRSKTHCPRNHPYDERNTGYTKRGARICRACARDKMRATRKTKKLKAAA